MATITSVGSGNWGTAGTWDVRVPLDDDTVVIASGHTVVFNVDTSGFANGINGLTITGTLTVNTAASSYLKMKAATYIGGAGTFNIGTSSSPIPFAVKFTLTGGAGWYITSASGLVMTVYGTEPTNAYVRLSGSEDVGQTELGVDTNITSDLWAVGDTVYICNINGALQVEERVIASGGIAAGAITVTAGLTAAKLAGSFVVLATRNVQIIAGSDTELLRSFTSAKFAMGSGEVKGNSTGVNARAYTGASATFTGGIFHKHGYVFSSTSWGTTIAAGTFVNIGSHVYSGILFNITGGNYFGCVNVVYSGRLVAISGGIFAGNSYCVNSTVSCDIIGGTFIGNDSIYYSAYFGTIDGTNAIFTNNKYFFNRFGGGYTAYNVDFNITNSEYGDRYPNIYSESVNHDQADGAFKAWPTIGTVVSQTTTKPTGYTQAYQHALASASVPTYWRKAFSVEPGKTVEIEVQLYKDASMAYLPRVYLMDATKDPLIGATPVDTFTMTDSINTWESDTFSVTNSTNYDKDYTLWFVGKNANGNAYSAYKITTAGGGGGIRNVPIPVFLHRRNR